MKKIHCLVIVMLCLATVLSAGPATRGVVKTLEIIGKGGKAASRPASKAMGKTVLKNAVKQTASSADDIGKGLVKTTSSSAKKLASGSDDAAKLLVEPAVQAAGKRGTLKMATQIGQSAAKAKLAQPGLASRVLREFGDDLGVKLIKQNPDDAFRLAGLAAKADSPATKKLLVDAYSRSPNRKLFLESLNAKNILAFGLSAGVVAAAYRTSGGLANGIEKSMENVSHVAPHTMAWSGAIAISVMGLVLLWPVRRALQCILPAKKECQPPEKENV
ncbi:MAG: hypothetical protein IJJ33_21355 [Victivallales bacterium]|nr:hypothetical protein [Victivallales bacterium]